MEYPIRSLRSEAIPSALEKAKKYRLLNDPEQAESICRDILRVDPGHTEAKITLILALTDRFTTDIASMALTAWEYTDQLPGDYEQCYFKGLICERRARAHLSQGTPASGAIAHEWIGKAFEWYDKAEKLKPPGNDDTVLRWNACARFVRDHGNVRPQAPEQLPTLGE